MHKKAGNVITVPIDKNGGVPVNIQDQTTKPIFLNFNNVANSTTLKSQATMDARTIDLTDTTGTAAGKYIIIFDPSSGNFSFYTQLGAAVGDTITLDTPLDFSYPAGSFVDVSDINLAVNGLVTPKVFGLRGVGTPTGVELTVDITGINFFCLASSAVELSLFADVTALTNGLVLRKRNDDIVNIANIKSNGQIASIANIFVITEATNPAQGQDGFYGSVDFAGQMNLGVAIRLPIGEDLEFIIQDNLSGITFLAVTASGHVIQN